MAKRKPFVVSEHHVGRKPKLIGRFKTLTEAVQAIADKEGWRGNDIREEFQTAGDWEGFEVRNACQGYDLVTYFDTAEEAEEYLEEEEEREKEEERFDQLERMEELLDTINTTSQLATESMKRDLQRTQEEAEVIERKATELVSLLNQVNG